MAHDLEPPGEHLRHAVRWISERRAVDPGQADLTVIDEASRRFDLTPLEEEFLLELLREKAPREKV